VTVPVLTADECDELSDLFDGGRFRSTIEMARYRFGDGRYRYFDHPLPDAIAALRASFYRRLAPIANHWAELLGGAGPAFPLEHEGLLRRCHAAGQQRPTPLILRYGEGDWNALHQDLYGEVYFPFQVLTILARPGEDFDGGQFVLLEQRPRAQSRAHVLEPAQGAFVIFPTRAAHRARRDLPRRYLRLISSPSRTATGIRSTISSSAVPPGSRLRNPSIAVVGDPLSHTQSSGSRSTADIVSVGMEDRELKVTH